MHTRAGKTEEHKKQPSANRLSQQPPENNTTFQFVDNRREAIAQRKLQAMAHQFAPSWPIQKKANAAPIQRVSYDEAKDAVGAANVNALTTWVKSLSKSDEKKAWDAALKNMTADEVKGRILDTTSKAKPDDDLINQLGRYNDYGVCYLKRQDIKSYQCFVQSARFNYRSREPD